MTAPLALREPDRVFNDVAAALQVDPDLVLAALRDEIAKPLPVVTEEER